jgi:dTDP-4-dehydrorhamnose reductase
MPFSILLTDSTFALARTIEQELEREVFTLLVPKESELDWSRPDALNDYLSNYKVDLIINTRGWNQADTTQGQAILLSTAEQLAQIGSAAPVTVIHLSSYQVFGGDTKGIHSEKDEVISANAMGHAFVNAEKQLQQLNHHVIIRLSWIISPEGDNLLTRLLKDFFAGGTVSVNHRLRGAPTTAVDVARVLVAVCRQIQCGADNWGTFHYCSSDSCGEDEFSEYLLQTLIQQQLLTAEPSLNLTDTDPINEPLSAILGCRRLRDAFGIQSRSWRPSLLSMVKHWLHNKKM